MSQKALILSADFWSMPDERTGEIRSGYSVWYINDYRDDGEGAIGFKPTKVSATPEIFEVLKPAQLPALFDLDFGSRPGQGGKATLTLVKAKHIKDVVIFEEPKAKAA